MKLLRTSTAIISLENVRRINVNVTKTNHTSRGVPYTSTNYSIVISYCNGSPYEHLDFGEGAAAKEACDTTFNAIYEELKKD